MSKYTLFLCGGKWQLPWLKFLKNKGHKIILVDPFSNSPCVEFADIFFKEDVKNVDSIITFVHENKFQIEMVTSEQTDVSTLPVSIIAKALDIQINEPEIVRRYANKGISRKFLKDNFNKHYPDFELITDILKLTEFIKKHDHIIIKPVDAQSSRGIHLLNQYSSINEVKSAYENCKSFSVESAIIAEQFIVGEEITLEGICLNNEHYTLTGSNKKHFRTGIASNLSYPLTINSKLEDELFSFHNSLIKKTGLITAITHAEYIISENEKSFYLVEVACRGGGSLIPSHIVPKVTSLNLYEIYYQAMFKSKFETDIRVLNNSSVTLHFFEFDSGQVMSIKGVEECKKLSFVIDIGLEFKVGDIIKNAQDDRSRQGYVVVSGISKEEVSANIEFIYNTIEINYEPTL